MEEIRDFLDDNIGNILTTAFVLFMLWGIFMQITDGVKHDSCYPYWSGDELVSDCSAGEARESFEP